MQKQINQIDEKENQVETILDEKDMPKFSSLEELDPKIYNLVKEFEIPDPPDKVMGNIMKNVMDSYYKEYRYGIFWRKVKIKTQELKDFLHERLPVTLEVVLASTILLFILGGIAYYKYATSKAINQRDLISNQRTPEINTTDHILNPSPSITEKIDSETIDDKTDKINKDYVSMDKTSKNDKLIGSRKHKRPETPKNIDKERDTVAIVRKAKVTDDTNNISEKKITLTNLVNVHVLPLEIENEESDPLDLDISKELTNAIANNKKWKLSEKSGAEASFKKQATDRALVLITNKGEILWKDKNYIENYKQDRNYIKFLVKSLTKHHR